MFTLATIAEHIQATIKGDPNCYITGIATLQDAQAGQLTFLDNPKYRQYLPGTLASAVVLTADTAEYCPTNTLIVAKPYVAYARVAQLFQSAIQVEIGIHPTAVIGSDCDIDPTASIAAHVVLEAGCKIAAGAIIGAHCSLGRDVSVGIATRLHSRVSLYEQVQVGDNVEIHSGAVIGADGFGFANDNGQWIPIPQMGSVIIGNRVKIGANTTIDRGTIGNTIIHDGVIIDNQIQIAHNVEIGENSAVAACTGISGSTKIGKNCIIAGGVGIVGHIQIVDNVTITAMTGVTNSIKSAGVYSSGMPALPNIEWRRNAVILRRIDKLVKRVKSLESALNDKL